MKKIILSLLFVLYPIVAFAQQTVITRPYKATTTNASSTIAVTNTFQSIFNSSYKDTGRVACTIANYSENTMYVFFGPIASATTANSIQLAKNQIVTCNIGGTVLQDQVSITGTSGGVFYAAQQ